MFPKLGVNGVGKSIELAAASLWDLGPDLFGLHEGPSSFNIRTHGLGAQALLVFLGKARVPQEYLESIPLRHLYFCDEGFLVSFRCHFWDSLHIVWFFNLAISADTHGSGSTWDQSSDFRD